MSIQKGNILQLKNTQPPNLSGPEFTSPKLISMASGQQFIAKTVDLNQLLPGKIYLTCSLIGECTLLLDRTEGQFQANMDRTPKNQVFVTTFFPLRSYS